jgi:hypothetical protein
VSSGWDACVQEPWIFLRWLECHPALAGYLQFVGVFVAIFGSAWIAIRTTRLTLQPTRMERAGRARVLTYRLLSIVTDIQQTTVRVREIVRQTEHGFLLAAAGQLDVAEWSFRIDAQIPADILSELHVLDGPVSEDIAQLHYCHSRYNDFVHRNVPLLRSYDALRRKQFIETFDTLFGAVESLATKSQGLLKAEHERFLSSG